MSAGVSVALRECAYLPAVLLAPRRTPAANRGLALRGVNAMLAHCRAEVPYFRDNPDYPDRPLRELTELAALPVITKQLLIDTGVDAFHDPTLRPHRFHTDVTSGTTGTRLRVRHDVSGYGYHGATVFRRFIRSGYLPWWRIAHIKPFPRPVRWFQRLGLFPRVVVGAGQAEEEILRQVLAVRPQLIMGYPVVLRGLLRVMNAEQATRLRRHLKLVMTDSELLTDETAELLADGFGVPILDEYSAYEVLTVSTQCRDGSMHIDEDRVWVEIVDPDGRPVPDGTPGSVVVTHFRERAMPLPRYQLGDRALIEPEGCRCGSGFRRMRLVDGRLNDFVTLPGGRRIYSGVFLSLAMFTPGVAECMVRQAADGSITVHLVPDRVPFDTARAAFADRFAELVDAPIELRFVAAERVELTAGGKGRFVESTYSG